MRSTIQPQYNQVGQTLIETMVAVFIMVMGITAALGLANYSLSASSGIRDQIIGMGLAREGVEAFKNMRDTNWLNDTLSADCYNFATGTAGDPASSPAYCYRDWLNPAANGFNITPPFVRGGQSLVNDPSFLIDFDASNEKFWNPVGIIDPSRVSYQLYYDADGGNNGFYTYTDTGTPSHFFRQVVMETNSIEAPFSQDVGARMLVKSRVWWSDAKCPAVTRWPGRGRCAIELQMYLTNWKTF